MNRPASRPCVGEARREELALDRLRDGRIYNLARTYAVQSRGVATVEVIGGRAVATITVGGVTRSIGSAVAFDSTFRVQATANPTSITIQPSGLVTTGLPFELVLTRSDAADTVRISGYGRVE